MPRILAFAGSARRESYNKKLIRSATGIARDAGADVTLIDLLDYPMPIYNGDLEAEQGLPEGARAFKAALKAHEGFMIASPEYNGAFSPLLKNALDWASRSEEGDDGPLLAYQNKLAAIMSASPGGLGGLRGLVHVRMLLNNLGVMVLPRQQAVGRAASAFDDLDGLKDERTRNQIGRVATDLVNALAKLKG